MRPAVFLLLASAAVGVNLHAQTPELNRWRWFAESTVGPETLAGGVISAGFGTATNAPREYGTHWEGFGQRFGMRLTGVVTGSAIEASVGAILNEDPRYSPLGASAPLRTRTAHVIRMTFLAGDFHGGSKPAYSRYLAVAGNNFLSNTWREKSEADVDHALIRTGTGFVARMAGNAFGEFWPDLKRKVLRHKSL